MKRFADRINISIACVIAWGCLEIVEMRSIISRVDERTKMLSEYIKTLSSKEKKAVHVVKR